jgi:serine/threonine-protein kinase
MSAQKHGMAVTGFVMPSYRDSNFARSLESARQAHEQGNLRDAVREVAAALAEDPNHADAIAMLDEILHAADEPLELIPDDDFPLPSSLEAVRSWILADQGEVAVAIHKLLDVISERPDVLYIDWVLGWLQSPEAASGLEIENIIKFIGSLHDQYAALAAPQGGGKETLTRVPLFVQLVRRVHRPDAQFLVVSAALLRRMGCLDEALKLSREAHDLEADVQTFMGIAVTHAAREEVEQALESYRAALALEPTSVTARLGMADLLVNSGRVDEAQQLYAEILEQDSDQETAKPSLYYLRFLTTGDESWQEKLLALAEQEPENERAGRLAPRITPFVGYLPSLESEHEESERPTDGLAARASRDGATTLWETPSRRLASGRLTAMVAVPQMTLDPRLPRGRVDFLLWRYDGTQPRIAVPPPDADVAQAIAAFASQPYFLDAWWGQARSIAHHLGTAKVVDVLATMAYPPRLSVAAQSGQAAQWVYHVQVAASLVIARMDEPWQGSQRRKMLRSLALGPMDWSVDAGLIALAAVARDEEDAAPEILQLFRELRKGATSDTSYYGALLWCALRLPDLLEEERSDIRQRLQKWRDARKAIRHYRQALIHAGKGDHERALKELTVTVELDPTSADAFCQRAELALRCSDPATAVADFSQALRLQPGMSAALAGRGQAHLKLGRFDQAISDFTEALRLAPWEWQAFYRRGLAHAARKEHALAIADFTEAIRLAPESPEPYMHRALACTHLGQYDQAIRDYTEQVQLNPQSPLAYNFRARLFYRQGNFAEALVDHRKAAELDPANPNTHFQLAWIWATCSDPKCRNGTRAVEAATKACELTEWKKAHCLDALAAALAETGRFDEAVQRQQQAVALASEAERPIIMARMKAYQQRRPWRIQGESPGRT